MTQITNQKIEELASWKRKTDRGSVSVRHYPDRGMGDKAARAC